MFPKKIPGTLAVITALATTCAGLLGTAPSARAAEATPLAQAQAALANPTITWTSCEGRLPVEMPPFTTVQCGDLVVPLDYSDLSLGTLTLPVSKRPATDPSHRIGSLFTNPGGPAEPATLRAPLLAELLGPEVGARFDILGVAPRGIEGEELALCPLGTGGLPPVSFRVFPMTPTEISERFALDTAITTACSKGPRILRHMGTADVARDMDQARRAVGDDRLSYFGTSYGTFLGATYASLFPGRIRAMVLDSVIDPVAWATGRGSIQPSKQPVAERMYAGEASKEALASAIAECEKAGPAVCPPAATIRHDWADLKMMLRMQPYRLVDGTELHFDELINNVVNILYSPSDIPMMLQLIHQLDVDLNSPGTKPVTDSTQDPVMAGTTLSVGYVKKLDELGAQARTALHGSDLRLDEAMKTPAPEAAQENFVASVGFNAVMCSETAGPTTPQGYLDADDRAWGNASGFGQIWLWQQSVCAKWPVKASNAYAGPFTQPTSTPVLMMSNEHDPATPLIGAQKYHRILPGSRLVTVRNGFGHGVVGSSTCADRARTSYLLTGRAPWSDQYCTPDKPLFGAA